MTKKHLEHIIAYVLDAEEAVKLTDGVSEMLIYSEKEFAGTYGETYVVVDEGGECKGYLHNDGEGKIITPKAIANKIWNDYYLCNYKEV